MRRTTTHPPPTARRRRRARRLAFVACATISVAALSATPALAAEGKPPKIESVGTAVGGEVTVSAHIDPEGLETTYEIKLECGPDEPVPCDSIPSERGEGNLPADYEVHEVKLTLTGLQPGTYWFGTRASNTAGEALWVSDGLNIPSPTPGAFPEGTGGGGIVESKPPEAVNNELKAIAIREEERRVKAKKQEEQKARELTARPASEPEHTEEQPPAAQPQTEHPACRVPALKGDTLSAARRALAKAHCRLGKIHRPTHHDGTLYVSAQGAPVGEQLAYNAHVALWVGAKRASHRPPRAAHGPVRANFVAKP